jgi:hypothetical protein
MLREYCGAVHVHSDHSDGSGSIPEILEAAKTTGLDYLLLTDHAEMSLCDPSWEDWHDGVLLALGCEISPHGQPHSLALDLPSASGLGKMTPADRLMEVSLRGGSSFVAHPRGKKMVGLNTIPWRAWESPFITGIEVWSYTYDWLEAFRWSRALRCYRRPHEYISGPHPEVLAVWDRLAARGGCSGIAGVDAHARPMLINSLEIFPYEMLFSTTLTHVLTEEFTHNAARDAAMVKEALCAGRCYMGYHVIGDPTGFRFFAQTDCECVEMGDSAPLFRRPRLTVELPAEGEARLIANGRIAGRGYGRRNEFTPEVPGAYRVEVRRRGEPWIFSNHIYLT